MTAVNDGAALLGRVLLAVIFVLGWVPETLRFCRHHWLYEGGRPAASDIGGDHCDPRRMRWRYSDHRGLSDAPGRDRVGRVVHRHRAGGAQGLRQPGPDDPFSEERCHGRRISPAFRLRCRQLEHRRAARPGRCKDRGLGKTATTRSRENFFPTAWPRYPGTREAAPGADRHSSANVISEAAYCFV